ncbi:TMEM175 family protein [Streptacidiphilus cavernicola]|uniref:TMEM175 family protein n=1 Tax=Streptacidiphilus cavernicola TaxID=3342716 RepID=A0ABV6VTR8_9ACTN
MARLNDSGRVEAFSDGVFAIAITLLILEVKVPSGPGIGRQLLHHWPSYAAYVVTFLIIGIMWANHHTVFSYVARVDRVLLFLNLLLLMVCSALPWAAGLVASYLDGADHGEAAIALAVYSGFMVAHALTFGALWWWLTRTGHLFDARVDVEAARGTRLRFALGSVVYPLLLGLSFVSAVLTLALHGLLAVYYGFNQLPVPLRDGAEEGDDEPVVL